jgi:hypothetical protein
MKRFLPVRSVRAAALAATLFTSACASIPDLGGKPEMSDPAQFASAKSLAGTQASWPSAGSTKRWSARPT